MEIIFQDENILAVNKPAFLVVYSSNGESLMSKMIEGYPDLAKVGHSPRYGLIHRLDKDTSGVILIARNQGTLEYVQKQFQSRSVAKKYIGLVHGEIKPSCGQIESYLNRSSGDFRKQKASPLNIHSSGRIARTNYHTKKNFNGYSLLEIQPETGRIHQIRAQLAWKGHPIVGDRLYQFKDQTAPECLKRMFLHSHSISFLMPSQEPKIVQAPLPEELKNALECLSNKQHVIIR